MERKVEELTGILTKTIAGWPAIECITVDPRADFPAYDPNFALVIDVYHKGRIPEPETRQGAFGNPGAFETATSRSKDRFFLEEIPIRIEYKDVRFIEKLVNKPLLNLRIIKNSGTYPFYRLQKNRVIHDSNGWIGGMRTTLETMPSSVWDALFDSFCTKMEHYLSDMGAAVFSADRYFLLVSQAGFMRYAAAGAFMANRRFEPSHRDIETQLRSLPKIPEGFWPLWEGLLAMETARDRQKRFENARTLARLVLSLK